MHKSRTALYIECSATSASRKDLQSASLAVAKMSQQLLIAVKLQGKLLEASKSGSDLPLSGTDCPSSQDNYSGSDRFSLLK